MRAHYEASLETAGRPPLADEEGHEVTSFGNSRAATATGGPRRSGIELDGPSRYDHVQELFRDLHQLPPESRASTQLRERIIVECLPLADHVARRYAHRGEPHDDLTQVARMGLVKAVDRFDPDEGAFLAFAVTTIMGEVKRYFRDFGWSVKVPRRLKDVYPQLGFAVNELSQKLGRSPTPTEVAEMLGVERSEVVEAMIAGEGYRTRSIDFTATSDDEKPTIADRMGDLDPGIRFIEDREALRAQMATLPERLQRLIVMRFFGFMTQDQIAEEMGISQMHVSRLLAQALRLLRDGMGGSDGESVMAS
ncbi:MAG: polymerase, sigma 37 subunit, RpsB/SigB [Mycobacterium sp.]|jgi:RNA polymerase sigma-B factor|nr:polymerase, sigma 37 subunit, RpsB/SigB [Mycobacterium sp.]